MNPDASFESLYPVMPLDLQVATPSVAIEHLIYFNMLYVYTEHKHIKYILMCFGYIRLNKIY